MQNRTETPAATGTQTPAGLQTRIDELTGIYPIEITGDVLNRTPRKHHLTVIHALDDVFGDLGDDFEDGDE